MVCQNNRIVGLVILMFITFKLPVKTLAMCIIYFTGGITSMHILYCCICYGPHMGNSVVTDVQFEHLFRCIYNMMHYMKLPVGYSERYHTVANTYRIMLCFSFLLTETRKGCDGHKHRNELSGTTKFCG